MWPSIVQKEAENLSSCLGVPQWGLVIMKLSFFKLLLIKVFYRSSKSPETTWCVCFTVPITIWSYVIDLFTICPLPLKVYFPQEQTFFSFYSTGLQSLEQCLSNARCFVNIYEMNELLHINRWGFIASVGRPLEFPSPKISYSIHFHGQLQCVALRP